MAEITIPSAVIEEPLVRERNFPPGTWQGEIEETRVRGFPDWVTQKQGYETEDGEILSIQLGSATALEEGQDSPGNQKCFADFVIRDGDINVWQVDPEDSDVTHWQMRNSWQALVQLGAALGAATQNGAGYSIDLEAFVEGLRSGVYDGAPVAFITTHRPYKSKSTGKKGVAVEVTQYMAAG